VTLNTLGEYISVSSLRPQKHSCTIMHQFVMSCLAT